MRSHLFLGESVWWPKKQSFRVGHYHSAVTRESIKIRLSEEKVTDRYNKYYIYIDYNIESATYGFLFTSCKTLENERVRAFFRHHKITGRT